jgi:PHB/PHA accumulation regulator DNA-binding domain
MNKLTTSSSRHGSDAINAAPAVTQRGSACAILPNMRKALIRSEADGRLYDTESMAHVSLSDVANMLVRGLRIIVEDATTGEDVTSEILDKLH